MAHIYTRRAICLGQIQKANILKIGPDRWGVVVLSSKARALNSLIDVRNRNHKIGTTSMTNEISLYQLTQPKLVLSVSVYRVSVVVYTHKISCL